MSGFAERLARPELMDDANVDPVDLAANFRDIEFANAVFGGAAPVVREVLATGARTVLDVGCGSADIPRAVVTAAARLGRDVWVTCADRSAAVLDIARRRSLGDPKLSFVQAEARRDAVKEAQRRRRRRRHGNWPPPPWPPSPPWPGGSSARAPRTSRRGCSRGAGAQPAHAPRRAAFGAARLHCGRSARVGTRGRLGSGLGHRRALFPHGAARWMTSWWSGPGCGGRVARAALGPGGLRGDDRRAHPLPPAQGLRGRTPTAARWRCWPSWESSNACVPMRRRCAASVW